MKKIIATVALLTTLSFTYAQTNTFPTTGNVGIGTTTPNAKLEVNSNSNAEVLINRNGYWGASSAGLKLSTDAVVSNYWTFGMLPNQSNNIYLKKNDRTDLTVLEINGNVGVGTLNPTSKLTVAGDIAYGDGFSNTLSRDDAGEFGANVKSGFYQTANPINYPSGAIGWWHLLDVRHSNVSNNYAMQFSGGFWDQELWFRKTSNTANQPWRKVIMEQTNGNVGIGTTNPQAKLDVNGETVSNSLTSKSDSSPSINIINTSKVGQGVGTTWRIYNMTGSYGNSLQFWAYDSVSYLNGGYILKLGDNGNMSLQGKLEAKEVKVTTTPTADFVFAENYALPKLEEVEKQIKEKKHLPEIASAKEMEKEGVNVGEFQIKLLQKIEELTLYNIEQNKQNKLQEEQIKQQQEQIKQLEVQNKELLELKKLVQDLKEKTNQ